MPEPAPGVGKRIRDAREARGLTQAQLAAALHIPRSEVSLVESDQRKLSAQELVTMAAILDVSLGEIVTANPNASFERGRTLGRREGYREAVEAMEKFVGAYVDR